MAADDELDATVTLTLSDLQIVRAALNSAFHYSTVLDLSEQYRKLTQRSTPSKLTQGLQNALTLVQSYIELGDEPEDV